MWEGIDPELRRQYDSLRTMVRLSHQSPAREWPLVFVSEFESLLVVREWPGGEVTAYGFRRRGRTAEHIGPVVGRGDAVKRVIESLASPSGDAAVIIDTPRDGATGAWLSDIGFDVHRELTRMWRGTPTPTKDVVAISGFELG